MGLTVLKEELKKRDEDIDMLYNYLTSSEDNDICNILKANIFIMLYNKVEFFFRELIFSIYDEIHDQKISFFDLKPHVQNIISGYLFPKGIPKDKKHGIIKNLFEDKFQYYKPEPTDIANGNIDEDNFNKILKTYQISDVNFYVEGNIKLSTLKDIRNTLAHGEKSFSEIGRSYSVTQLKILKEDLERIFLEIRDKLEISLNEKFYLND